MSGSILLISDLKNYRIYKKFINLNASVYLHIFDNCPVMKTLNNSVKDVSIVFDISNENLLLENNVENIIVYGNLTVKQTYFIVTFINNYKVTNPVNLFSNTTFNIVNDKYTLFNNSCETIVSVISKNPIIPKIISTPKIPSISKNHFILKTHTHSTTKPHGHFSSFCKMCAENIDLISKIQIPTIEQYKQKEAVFVEFRILPHIEFIIRNCILKVGNNWSYTVVCGNDNYDFCQQLCNKIHTNIKIIKLDVNNFTHNDYNNLLLTSTFWNLFYGEKILIYQSDSLIFKRNIDDFLHWDYVGSPFPEKSNIVLSKEQVGNGGLSIRTKSVMLKVIENVPIKDDEYSSNVLTYKRSFKLDAIPEDIYFSQNIQNSNLGTVADFKSAIAFSVDSVYGDDSFGMHKIWNGNCNWKPVVNKYMTEFNEIKTDVFDVNYLNKLHKYCITMNISQETVLNDAKQEFRYFCYNYIDYIRLLQLPIISQQNKYEAVLIEFRCFPHIEFLIRNSIHKLGKEWSQTIVCGNQNYEFIKNIVNKIDRDVQIIKLNYDNLTQNEYSDLLREKQFWNMFAGEKILIHQEDSCIFKSNINDFFKWDYIGAAWNNAYEINKHSVGNGGFSLRSKNIMLKCCEFNLMDIDIPDTVLKYMTKNALTNIPEDVYFTSIMEKYSIGEISDINSANLFSSESFYNRDSMGGHQFWLNNVNWKKHLYESFDFFKKPKYNIIYEDNVNCLISNISIDLRNCYINDIKLQLFHFLLEKNTNIKMIKQLNENNDIHTFFVNKKYIINPANINYDVLMRTFNEKDILLIDSDNYINKYNILFSAIFFPQYHEIHENNTFWGKGFTEWSLLKPFNSSITINNEQIPIMKPHDDIGYYELNSDTFNTQINMSTNYGIDVLFTYHYWFENCKKVMEKPLEFYKVTDKKFCLCWANEPWTKRWDGLNCDVLLKQSYTHFYEMIVYLYDFFKLPNYLRDFNNNIVYFIYNYNDIGEEKFNNLKVIWSDYLKEKGENIVFIFSSSFIYDNTSLKNTNCYLFEPLENNINRYGFNSQVNVNDNYWEVDYNNVINFYKKIPIVNLINKMQGVPLNWNNAVRRKKLKFLYVNNFTVSNLILLFTIQISNIMLKDNLLKGASDLLNMININAWNEWNEQAILEPNNITGYENLDAIKYLKNRLQEPLLQKKTNLLLVDIFIDKINNGGASYTLSIIKQLSKKFNVYYHPNNNKFSEYFNNLIKPYNANILIDKSNNNCFNSFKNYNFEKIIIARVTNHYLYNRLIKIYPNKKLYIMLTHDIHHLRDLNITKINELDVYLKYNKCIMISKQEISYLKTNNFCENKLIHLSPKYDNKQINYNPIDRNGILFISSDHEPNVNGINIFINKYFLNIVKINNSIKLHIFGNCCKKITIEHPNIIKYFFVENLDTLVSQFRVAIIPLICGAGLKIKIIESLNYGIPIISTKKGLEGFDLNNTVDYYNLELDIDVNEYTDAFLNIYNNFKQLKSVSLNQKLYFNKYFTPNLLDDIEISKI